MKLPKMRVYRLSVIVRYAPDVKPERYDRDWGVTRAITENEDTADLRAEHERYAWAELQTLLQQNHATIERIRRAGWHTVDTESEQATH